MNTDKLLGKMREKHVSYTQLAAYLGFCERTLSNKIKKGKFYTDEVEKIAVFLNLSHDEFMKIFFKNLVA